jgi:two-component system sensor kinase FixL
MGSDFAQALMDAATDAVVVIDHHGVMEVVNAAAGQLFGYATAELVGRNVSMLMPEAERARHDGYIARYLESGVAHVIGRGREVEARRSDGSIFPASLSVGRIDGTTPPRFVGFVHDLTEYRRALMALQADRDRARAREADAHRSQSSLLAVSRMATMGEMASGIAHEINQPLTAISNYARACARFAAQQPPALDDLQDCMNEIANETQRAADIIRELRDLVRARPEDRALKDLGDIVRQTRQLILADARAHGTTVHFDIAAALPPVAVEAVQIQQLLLNLVRNALEALEACEHGKREIRITTGATSDGDIELSVVDNGPGVDPQVQHDMFEPFVSTKPFGTGLGLAISRTIAQNHGGKLLLRPGEAGGTCFTLRLTPHELVPAQ